MATADKMFREDLSEGLSFEEIIELVTAEGG